MPKVLLVIALLVIAVNAAMMFIGAFRTGVSVDEPRHVDRLNEYFDNGWYVPPVSGEAANSADQVESGVYAPVTALLGHMTAVIAGAEDFGEVSDSSDAFAMRHVTVASLALLGLAAVGLSAARLMGSWRWGVLAASALSAIPMWTGHAMFNIKDTPVAVGYALFTAGLVGLVRRHRARSRRQEIADFALLLAGLVLGVGTRPGMWVIMLLTAGVGLAAATVLDVRLGGWRGSARGGYRSLVSLGISAVLAFLFLLLIYPKEFAHPLKLAWDSATNSAKFDKWNKLTLTNGSLTGQPAPWWYVPTWIANQVPVILLCLVLLGFAFGIAVLVSALRRQEKNAIPLAMPAQATIFFLPSILVPLSAALLGSHVYGGIRQLLFLLPSLAVLCALGLYSLLDLAEKKSNGKPWLWRAVVGIAAVGLVLPTVDQVRLFPYNYTYFNEVATLQPIDGRWATDYWRTSYREIAPEISLSARTVCIRLSGPESLEEFNERAIEGDASCRKVPMLRYFASETFAPPPEPPLSQSEYLMLSENRFGLLVPDNCTVVATVTRPLRWQTVMMSYVARCDLDRAP